MILDDIADYLSSGGVTTTMRKGFMTETPDAVVTIYEYPGAPAVHAMASAPGQAKLEMPSIQVVVRAGEFDYQAARATANTIWKLLDGFPERSINGVRYAWIVAKQSPYLLGRDESRRPLIACNFEVWKELT